MTYEEFHRWTVSKELECPAYAEVMRELRALRVVKPGPKFHPAMNFWSGNNQYYGQAYGRWASAVIDKEIQKHINANLGQPPSP